MTLEELDAALAATKGARWLAWFRDDEPPRFALRAPIAELRAMTDGRRGRPLGSWEVDSTPFRAQIVCRYPRGEIRFFFTNEPWVARNTTKRKRKDDTVACFLAQNATCSKQKKLT